MIKGRPIQIITERLVLRSLSELDKDALFILFNDAQVKKTYMIPDLGHRMGILNCSTAEMKMSLGC